MVKVNFSWLSSVFAFNLFWWKFWIKQFQSFNGFWGFEEKKIFWWSSERGTKCENLKHSVPVSPHLLTSFLALKKIIVIQCFKRRKRLLSEGFMLHIKWTTWKKAFKLTNSINFTLTFLLLFRSVKHMDGDRTRQNPDLTNTSPHWTLSFTLPCLTLFLLQLTPVLWSMCVVSSVSVAENDGHSTSSRFYTVYTPRCPAPAGSPGSRVCCIVMRTEKRGVYCNVYLVFIGWRGKIRGDMLLKLKHFSAWIWDESDEC